MLVIGIAGGSGSGKTTVVKKIVNKCGGKSVTIISQDAYYKDKGELSEEEKRKINFDHPSSIEFSLLVKHLDMLKKGKSIQMPIYSYLTCARAKETVTVHPNEVIIVEGILILSNPQMRRRIVLRNVNTIANSYYSAATINQSILIYRSIVAYYDFAWTSNLNISADLYMFSSRPEISI